MGEVSTTLEQARDNAAAAVASGKEEARRAARRTRRRATKQAAQARKKAAKEAGRRAGLARKETSRRLAKARKQADKRSRKARKKAGRLAGDLAAQLAEPGTSALGTARDVGGQVGDSLAENVVKARRELADRLDPAPKRRRRKWTFLLLLVVAGAAGAAVLARRPRETDSGSAGPVAMTPRVRPVPENPPSATSSGNGAVDAERRSKSTD